MGAFFGAHFFEKRALACLHPLKRCHFKQVLTKFFSNTQDTKLGAIIAPSKVLIPLEMVIGQQMKEEGHDQNY